jgi:hypothetical protein
MWPGGGIYLMLLLLLLLLEKLPNGLSTYLYMLGCRP